MEICVLIKFPDHSRRMLPRTCVLACVLGRESSAHRVTPTRAHIRAHLNSLSLPRGLRRQILTPVCQNLIIDIAVQGGQHAVRHLAFSNRCTSTPAAERDMFESGSCS